jgi:hypothetical protein
MISPSKQICPDCEEKRRSTGKLRLKLNSGLEEAIEEFIEKHSRKANSL